VAAVQPRPSIVAKTGLLLQEPLCVTNRVELDKRFMADASFGVLLPW
jgi:hypothetical protein